MITITNISKEFKQFGEHEYEVRINKEIKAKFVHKREDGLTICLQEAAKAVEKAKWEEFAENINKGLLGNYSAT